jgi:hypothetical protein
MDCMDHTAFLEHSQAAGPVGGDPSPSPQRAITGVRPGASLTFEEVVQRFLERGFTDEVACIAAAVVCSSSEIAARWWA